MRKLLVSLVTVGVLISSVQVAGQESRVRFVQERPGESIRVQPGEIVNIVDPEWSRETREPNPPEAPGPQIRQVSVVEFLQDVAEGLIPLTMEQARELVNRLRGQVGAAGPPSVGVATLLDTGITYWRLYWDGIDQVYSCRDINWKRPGDHYNASNQAIKYTLLYSYTKNNGYESSVSVDAGWITSNIGFNVSYSQTVETGDEMDIPAWKTAYVDGKRNWTCKHFKWHADHVRVYWDTETLAFVYVVFETTYNSGTGYEYQYLSTKNGLL